MWRHLAIALLSVAVAFGSWRYARVPRGPGAQWERRFWTLFMLFHGLLGLNLLSDRRLLGMLPTPLRWSLRLALFGSMVYSRVQSRRSRSQLIGVVPMRG